MKLLACSGLLVLLPLAAAGSLLTESFTSSTTLQSLLDKGWTVGANVTSTSLTFSSGYMKLENNGGGFYNLRSPVLTPTPAGSVSFTFGADASAASSQGRFALMGGGTAQTNEIIRVTLQNNNTTLRVATATQQDFQVANFNLAAGGQFLNLDINWDGSEVVLFVNGSELTRGSYFNATRIPDRFEFVAGFSTSTGIRAVAASEIMMAAVPEPSTFAALTGAFAIGLAAFRRTSRKRF